MTKPKIEPAEQTAVIYGRISSEDQMQGFSLQAQLRACREWAEKNAFKIVREYVEEGHSAFRNLDKREAFRELLSDAASKEHPFDIISFTNSTVCSGTVLSHRPPERYSSASRCGWSR
jgi:hypothetical protein